MMNKIQVSGKHNNNIAYRFLYKYVKEGKLNILETSIKHVLSDLKCVGVETDESDLDYSVIEGEHRYPITLELLRWLFKQA